MQQNVYADSEGKWQLRLLPFKTYVVTAAAVFWFGLLLVPDADILEQYGLVAEQASMCRTVIYGYAFAIAALLLGGVSAFLVLRSWRILMSALAFAGLGLLIIGLLAPWADVPATRQGSDFRYRKSGA